MRHVLKREGQWFKSLAKLVSLARKGDIIEVADMEMLGYAVFGIESRGLVTTNETGIRVHLTTDNGPIEAGMEKGTMTGRRSAEVNIPKETNKGVGTFMQELLAEHTPNANNDVFPPEAVRRITRKPTDAEIAAHQAKHRIAPYGMDPVLPAYNVRDVFHTHSMFSRMSRGTQRTLTRDWHRDLVDQNLRVVLHPDRTVDVLVLSTVSTPAEQYVMKGVPLNAFFEITDFLNCPMAPPELIDYKAWEERITKLMDEAKASGVPMQVFPVDSISMTGRQTGKTALVTEMMKQNPCATIRGRGKADFTASVLRQYGKWKHQKEKVPGDPDQGVETREVSFDEARSLLFGNTPEMTPAEVLTNRMWQAVLRNLPIAMIVGNPVEHTQYLIPPRYQLCFEGPLDEMQVTKTDEYPDDQKFVCQGCHKQYVYGEAKKALSEGRAGAKYTPLGFCSEKCGDAHLRRTGFAVPAIGAEIMLGDWEMCNLGRGEVQASEAKVMDPLTGKAVADVYTEVHETASDPMGLDKIAGTLGLEPVGPTIVVEQQVKKNGEG